MKKLSRRGFLAGMVGTLGAATLPDPQWLSRLLSSETDPTEDEWPAPTTIRVPEDYSTANEAVDVAAAGDTITLSHLLVSEDELGGYVVPSEIADRLLDEYAAHSTHHRVWGQRLAQALADEEDRLWLEGWEDTDPEGVL